MPSRPLADCWPIRIADGRLGFVVGDRFRNHPPLRENGTHLIRAGHQAGENGSNENILAPSLNHLSCQGVFGAWPQPTRPWHWDWPRRLAQGADRSFVCSPRPGPHPLIRSARVLSDHGLRIIEGSTPIESVRNALGVFLAGESGSAWVPRHWIQDFRGGCFALADAGSGWRRPGKVWNLD